MRSIPLWIGSLGLAMLLTACGGATPASAPTELPLPTETALPEPTGAPSPTVKPTTVPAVDEPVQISGTAEITFFLFEDYVREPLVLLEDMAGFVARDFEFEIAPTDQIVGPLIKTGDDTWEYRLNLPVLPPGTSVDVDNDGETETGVQVYAVSVQANLEDDIFLNRDEYRGWSTVWASTRNDSENEDEVIGGKLIVWVADDQQGFPSSFGDDGLLFTADDPSAAIPAGYTIVDLDASPFEFYKEARPDITLYEGDVAVKDFTDLSYSEAFDSLWTQASAEYPFTQLKGIDWQSLYDEFAPRVARAGADNDATAWYLAMRDFAWSIPDGHVGVQGDDGGLFQAETSGGIGLAITGLDDGRIIVHIVLDDGPAAEAGIELGAQILDFNGTAVDEAIAAIVPWSSPFSTEHSLLIQQYRYLLRGRLGEQATLTWLNPGQTEPQTTTLDFVPERESFNATSIYAGFDRNALPVEYEILEDSGYGYIRVNSLSDDLNLIIRLFERGVTVFANNSVPGVIIDMRQNLGAVLLG